MKTYLKRLISGKNLTQSESYHLFSQLSQHSPEQQAAVLALLAIKKETVDELLGTMRFMMEQSTSMPSPDHLIDIVGTGGDGMGTFNISTAASLVIASCGIPVAKHGGKKVTSQAGCIDVLQALGIPQHQTKESCIQQLNERGYTYLWAPLFNQALKNMGELRQKLGVSTIFNTLGPLLNPMRPKRQVIGVYRPDLLHTISQVLCKRGVERALVVHSEEGLDEFSISAPTHVADIHQGNIRHYTITPESLGLTTYPLDDVLGGDATDNANTIRGLFLNQITGAKLDIVLLNSAAGLLVAEAASSWPEGIDMAKNAIQSGRAHSFLTQLQS